MTTKVDARTVRAKIFLMAVDPYNIGIQMNQNELKKTFMMISNLKTIGCDVFYKLVQIKNNCTLKCTF